MSRSDVSDQPIVITGMGLVTGLGANAEQTWSAILTRQNGIRAMASMESVLPPGKDGGEAVVLPPSFCPELPREARYLRWSMVQALEQAGVHEAAPYDPFRCCYMIGTTLHGMRAAGRYLRSGDTKELRNFLAGDTLRLATDGLPLRGGAATTCSACSSSLGSIALGVTLLKTGAADLVVAGGYDTISEYAWGGFNALRLVSDPPLRPFTRGRSGLKLAEAYGIVILERGDAAKARGAKALVHVAGWGESADAHHLTQPHPQGEGAARAMQQALDRAGVTPCEIDLVAAHATGTPDNDSAEYAAMSRLMGERMGDVPVVAFKSHLGHTLGGAGATELILAALAQRDQILPPCANLKSDEIEYAPLRLNCGEPTKAKVRHTLNTSLGFGGANTCVVLGPVEEKSPAIAVAPRQSTRVCITGIGVLLPGIVGNEQFIERLARNDAAPAEITGITIGDSDFEHLLNARRIRRMSNYVKLTLASVTLACRDAGITDLAAIADSTSAILGTTHGSAAYSHDYYSQIVSEGVLAANPMLFAEGVPNAGAAQLSLMLGLRGACQTIIGTRTAGLDALRLAAMRIASGDWDRAIVSAGEESSEHVNRAYTDCGLRAAAGQESLNADERGFFNVPGAVTLVLESEPAALARGAKVYGYIDDHATASGPRDKTAHTIASVLHRLPRTDHVIGSADNTWLDRAESLAFRQLERRQPPTNIYNVTGELFSATPLAGIAAALLTDQTSAGGDSGGEFISLCSDWSGLATGVYITRGRA